MNKRITHDDIIINLDARIKITGWHAENTDPFSKKSVEVAKRELAILQSIKLAISWNDFKDEQPKYGDVIVIRPAPESKMKPRVITYDRDSEWMEGDLWQLLIF